MFNSSSWYIVRNVLHTWKVQIYTRNYNSEVDGHVLIGKVEDNIKLDNAEHLRGKHY
jgi:hypothetical protein